MRSMHWIIVVAAVVIIGAGVGIWWLKSADSDQPPAVSEEQAALEARSQESIATTTESTVAAPRSSLPRGNTPLVRRESASPKAWLPLPSDSTPASRAITPGVHPAPEFWSDRCEVAFAPSGQVRELAFVSDDRRLALAEGGRHRPCEVRVMDIETEKLVWRRTESTGVTTLAVSHDGRQFAVAAGDNGITLCDTATGKELRRLVGHVGDVSHLLFSADDRSLLSAGGDRTARLWDCSTGRMTASEKVHAEWISSVGLTADARELLVTGSKGSRQWWNLQNNTLTPGRQFSPIAHERGMWASPSGKFVVVVTDQTEERHDSATDTDAGSKPEVKQSPKTAPQPRVALYDGRDGDLLTSMALAESGQLATQQPVFVVALAFSPDETQLALGLSNGDIVICSTEARRILTRMKGRGYPVEQMAFSSNGRRLATAGSDGAVRIWTLPEGTAQRCLILPSDELRPSDLPVRSTLAANGQLAVFVRKSGELDLIDPAAPFPVRTVRGPAQRITALSISSDARFVAAGYFDGIVSVWDLAGSAVAEVVRPQASTSEADEIKCLAFAADGTRFLAATRAGRLRLIESATRAVLGEAELGSEPIEAAAVAPDGRSAAVAFSDGSVRLVQLPGWNVLRVLDVPKGTVENVTISAAGDRVAALATNGTVYVWQAATGRELAAVVIDPTPTGSSVAQGLLNFFWKAAAPTDGKLTGSPASSAVVSADRRAIVFTPSGESVITASSDSVVVAIDIAKQNIRQQMLSYFLRPTALAIRNSDGWLVGITRADVIMEWSAALAAPQRIAAHSGDVRFVETTPDGMLLISGGSDQTIRLWDPATGKPLHTLQSPSGAVTRGAVSPDGQLLVTCGYGSGVDVWDLSARKLVRKQQYGHKARVDALAFSPDGKRVATGGWDKTVLIRDVELWRSQLALREQELPVISIAWSPDGRQLVTCTGDWRDWHLTGPVRVWDASTGQEIKRLPGILGQSSAAEFSRDGSFLITSSGDGLLRLWQVGDWSEDGFLRHRASIRAFALLSSGRLVVSVDHPATICVWDTQSGTLRCRFPAPTPQIFDIAAPFDADWFAAACSGGEIQIWRLTDMKSGMAQRSRHAPRDEYGRI